MGTLELHRLRYFVAVAEEGGITRAAQRLALAQPALSVQMRRLEEEVGTALFARGRQGVTLTEAGQALLPHAREVLHQAKEGVDAARSIAQGQRGRLAIGYMIALAYDLMPRLVTRLREHLPGVDLDLVELTVASRKQALLERQVVLAVCMPTLEHPGVATRQLYSQRLVVAMPAQDPIARLRQVPLVRLQGRPLIDLPQGSEQPGATSLARHILRQAGVVMPRAHSVASVHSALGLILAGEGVAILPEGVSQLRLRGIAFRRLADVDRGMDVTLCWLQSEQTSLLTRALDAIGSLS